MRPVKTGPGAVYAASLTSGDGLRAQGAVETWQTNLDEIRHLQSWIGGIDYDPPSYSREAAKRAKISLEDLLEDQDDLQKAYDKAFTPAPTGALSAAQETARDELGANLNLQAVFLRTVIDSVKDCVAAKWYQDSKNELRAALGQYCSYCEMPLYSSLEVEHMLPRSDFPSISLLWNNFLLACPVCNNTKSNRPSYATGLASATLPPPAPEPTADQIRTAARGYYLWPTDDDYKAWQSIFHYHVERENVLLPSDAWPSFVPIEASLKSEMTQSSLPIGSQDDGGRSVQISYWTPVLDPKSGAPVAAVPLSDYAALDGGVVSAELRDTIASLPAPFTTPNLPDYQTLTLTVEHPGTAWRLRIVESYLIEISDPEHSAALIALKASERNAKLYPTFLYRVPPSGPDTTGAAARPTVNSSSFIGPVQTTELMALRTRLQAGVVPVCWSTALSGAPYFTTPTVHQIDITPVGATQFLIDVTKSFRLTDSSTGVNLEFLRSFPVRAEIKVNSPATPRGTLAQRVIDDLQLNGKQENSFGDNSVFDRRLLKRTRAWVSAMNSVRNLNSYVSSDPGPLLPMIMATASATGFWSVWLTVFTENLSGPLLGKMTDLLYDPSYFPGTRR